jgi:hypothetical protein
MLVDPIKTKCTSSILSTEAMSEEETPLFTTKTPNKLTGAERDSKNSLISAKPLSKPS